MKNKLINYPILGYQMFDRVFRITSDASMHAIGATLTQMQPSGVEGITEEVERVIAYTSKQLSESQYKFSTIKKELFALFHATKVWHCYLFFNEVHAYTDHATLRWLKEQKPEHGRLFSWSQRLKLYDLKVFYKPGKVNQAADTLSRINKNVTWLNMNKVKEGANKKNSSEEERVSHIDVINASIQSSLSEWRREQSRDSYCRMAFDKIMAANTRHANRGGTTELGKRGERSPSIEEINSEGKEINREEIEGMEWTSKALQHTAYEKKLIPKGDFSNI